jgi:transcriptional antiterminator RfaH
MSHWYLIHTKIRREQCALQNLERQGFECYLPQIQSEKLRRGKLAVHAEPLFPRYLFVRLGQGLAAQKSWAPIRSTTGVSRLVAFGNVPAEIDDGLVDLIRAQTGGADAVRRQFEPGQPIFITQGPFAGLEAVYQMSDGESRVMVLLNILSKNVKMSLAPNSIHKAM